MIQIFFYPAASGTVSSEKISLNFTMPIAASPIQWGFFYALALSTALAMGNYMALRWAKKRSLQQLLAVLVGGFLVRLAIFGTAVVWVLKFSSLDGKAFTWTLLISYLIFQFIETLIFQRYFKQKKPTS